MESLAQIEAPWNLDTLSPIDQLRLAVGLMVAFSDTSGAPMIGVTASSLPTWRDLIDEGYLAPASENALTLTRQGIQAAMMLAERYIFAG